MGSRLSRFIGVIAVGCTFQVAGCDSQQVADIVRSNARDAIVGVGTFVVETATDRALGIQPKAFWDSNHS